MGVVDQLSLCGATVTVMTPDGGEGLAAKSSDRVQELVEIQFTLGQGPSIDAFATGRPVLVPALAAATSRWVGFSPAAMASGITGVYAFPLGLGAIRLGVLTCYAEADQVLSADELQRCLLSADAAAQLLLSSSADEDSLVPDPDVQDSLDIRAEVYQAQGMLMVELGISLSDALVRLRAMAFADDIDLNRLAIDLVTGRRAFPERNEGG